MPPISRKRPRTSPESLGNSVILYEGDCLEVLKEISSESVEAIVTDPPYGLFFMGKKWDYDVPSIDIWRECLRVIKPGGYLLAFAGTRTQHRMAVRIEDAGFEIRDMIAWVYGSGFPKSLDVSKAIDKAAGAERKVVGEYKICGMTPNRPNFGANDRSNGQGMGFRPGNVAITAPATPEARQWAGWGTALKPALEPITVARKPLTGTVIATVEKYGTGAMNIDASRVASTDPPRKGNTDRSDCTQIAYGSGWQKSGTTPDSGRWPANFIHDGNRECEDLLGTASRFFYCAKTSKQDRGKGNYHPTVKPTSLMRYLCRLVTRPGGTILDPFAGSGSTGKAAILEGFKCLLIEKDLTSCNIIRDRLHTLLSGDLG